MRCAIPRNLAWTPCRPRTSRWRQTFFYCDETNKINYRSVAAFSCVSFSCVSFSCASFSCVIFSCVIFSCVRLARSLWPDDFRYFFLTHLISLTERNIYLVEFWSDKSGQMPKWSKNCRDWVTCRPGRQLLPTRSVTAWDIAASVTFHGRCSR